MRAFAGESQARNRYTIAAVDRPQERAGVIQGLFLFTADQEKAHAKEFYRQLHDLGGQTVRVDGTYPVDLYADLLDYCGRPRKTNTGSGTRLCAVCPHRHDEGFPLVGKLFENIAAVEKIHGDRFGRYADMLEQGGSLRRTSRWSGCVSTAAMCDGLYGPRQLSRVPAPPGLFRPGGAGPLSQRACEVTRGADRRAVRPVRSRGSHDLSQIRIADP